MEKSRTVALTLIQEELKNALKHTTTPTTSLQEDASSSVQPKRILLILDDNFHLRSMRHDIYKCCQDFLSSYSINNDSTDSTDSSNTDKNITSQHDVQIGISILHITTPLSKCIEQNHLRHNTKEYIPIRIIEKMSRTLEAPDPSKAKFESCTIHYQPNHHDDDDEYHDSPSSTITTILPQIYQAIDQSLKDAITLHPVQLPTLQPTKTPQELEQERQVTLQSRAHRIDRMSRVLVRYICQTNSLYAKVANQSRKEILKECKRREYQVDEEESVRNDKGSADDVGNHSSSTFMDQLDRFVLTRFKDDLKTVEDAGTTSTTTDNHQHGKSNTTVVDIDSILCEAYKTFLNDWNKSCQKS